MANQTLEGVIMAIQDVTLAATSISSPDYPPEDLILPMQICYPYQLEDQGQSDGWRKVMATLYLELHLARVQLEIDAKASVGYYEDLMQALWANPQLSGAAQTIDARGRGIQAIFGGLSWGSKDNAHIGWRFIMDVKYHGAID